MGDAEAPVGGPRSVDDAARDAVAAWEAAGRSVEAAGHRVFVRVEPPAVDEGATPMLVLHGFPTCSFDWRHVLSRLAARRSVVLLDFPGFGLSAKPDLRYGIRMQADAAEGVAAALGLDRVVLVTHDMGDSVGGELLARDIDGELGFSVERRVLTNGSIYLDMAHLTAGQQLLMSLPDERLDLPDGVSVDAGAGFRAGLGATFSPGHPASDGELAAQWLLLQREGGQALMPRTIRYLEDRRVEERRYTGAIETHPSPLGVVWGDLDPVAVHAMTGALLEARPGTPLITLDGVGHYPMVEAPDRFADAVDALIDRGGA